MVYKIFFAPNSPIFWMRLAKNREEEHRQLQNVMQHLATPLQLQHLVGPHYAGPKWHYFFDMALKGLALCVCL